MFDSLLSTSEMKAFLGKELGVAAVAMDNADIGAALGQPFTAFAVGLDYLEFVVAHAGKLHKAYGYAAAPYDHYAPYVSGAFAACLPQAFGMLHRSGEIHYVAIGQPVITSGNNGFLTMFDC